MSLRPFACAKSRAGDLYNAPHPLEHPTSQAPARGLLWCRFLHAAKHAVGAGSCG
jgi:hypothetical protein